MVPQHQPEPAIPDDLRALIVLAESEIGARSEPDSTSDPTSETFTDGRIATAAIVDDLRAGIATLRDLGADESILTPFRVLVIHGQVLLESHGVTVESFFTFTEDAKNTCLALEAALKHPISV